MNLNSYKILSVFAVTIMLSSVGFGQCKSFTKKKCMPDLLPYIHNGQLNSISLFPGESASLKVPFYSGQDYRIMACAHKLLGDVYFEVKTSDDNPVYNSQGKSNAWDFNVASTQELTIDVYVAEDEAASEMAQSGCVAVLVGFKQ